MLRRSRARATQETADEILARYVATKDPQLRGQLVKIHQKLVFSIAKKYANKEELMEDLVQVGTIGLIEAIDRFDIKRGCKFSTYAHPCIAGGIKRYLRGSGKNIKIPRRLRDISNKLRRLEENLTQEFQRKPTLDELIEASGYDRETVMDVLIMNSLYYPVSLDEPLEEDDKRTTEDITGNLDLDILRFELGEVVRGSLKDLSEKHRFVLQLRFYEDKKLQEIAKILGCTRANVSCLIKRSLRELRWRLRRSGTYC